MKRALLALVLSPLAASLCFGWFGIIAYPFMLFVVLCIALPLFLYLRHIGLLAWHHALISGAFCGACFVAFDTLMSYSVDMDRLLNQQNVLYVSLGAVVGLVFWWTGIFRNPAFPFIPRAAPRSFVLVLPLTACIVSLHSALELGFHKGRVVTVLAEPTVAPRDGQVTVRLSTGQVVEADLSDTWPIPTVVGHCFHLQERWSTVRLRRVYQLISPFGGDVNDC